MNIDDVKKRELPPHLLINLAIKTVGVHFLSLLPVCLLLFLPPAIIRWAFIPLDGININMASLADIDPIVLKYSFLSTGIDLIFKPLAFGVFAFITIKLADGKKVSFSDALDMAVNRWARLFYTAVVFFVFIIPVSAVTGPFFLIPMVFFTITFMLCLCVAVHTKQCGLSALLISRVMMRGRWLRGFWLCVLLIFFYLLVSVLFYTPMVMYELWSNPYMLALNELLRETATSFVFVAIALFYINIQYSIKNFETNIKNI